MSCNSPRHKLQGAGVDNAWEQENLEAMRTGNT